MADNPDPKDAPLSAASIELLIAQHGIRGTLDHLVDYAQQLHDAAPAGDRLAQFRAASDHRKLVNLREQVYN